MAENTSEKTISSYKFRLSIGKGGVTSRDQMAV
jgi:hypothetical protein